MGESCPEMELLDEMDRTVEVNLYLPRESYEALERLQQLCGHKSIAQTIREALRLYGVDEDAKGRLIGSSNPPPA